MKQSKKIWFVCLSAPINVNGISFHALSVSIRPAAAAAAPAVCSKISSRLETSFLVRNTALPTTLNKFAAAAAAALANVSCL